MSIEKKVGYISSCTAHNNFTLACAKINKLLEGRDGEVCKIRCMRESGLWFVSWYKMQEVKVSNE